MLLLCASATISYLFSHSIYPQDGLPISGSVNPSRPAELLFRIEEGEFLRLAIEPRKAPLAAALHRPDGTVAVSQGNSRAGVIPLAISLRAESGGLYRLRLSVPQGAIADSADFRVRVLERRPWEDADESLLQAQRHYLQAEASASRRDERAAAIESYQQAIRLWRRSRAQLEECLALNSLARLRTSAGELELALQEFEQAQALASRIGARELEGAALYGAARVHSSMGDNSAAIESYRRSAEIRRGLQDRFGEALAQHNLGAAHWLLGRSRESLQHFRQALSIREEIGDRTGIAYSRYGIGVAHWSLGEDEQALIEYQRMIEIWRTENNSAGEADGLNSMGLIYASLRDDGQALSHLNQALSLWQKLDDGARQGYALNNLGLVRLAMGQPLEARRLFDRALSLLDGDRRGKAYALHNTGRALLQQGQARVAMDHFRRSLELKRQLGDRFGEAFTLDRMGESYRQLGDLQQSREHFSQALTLRRLVGDRKGEVLTLAGLARLGDRQGDLSDARQWLDQALQLVEGLRLDFDSLDLRTSFFASQHDFYRYYIDLSMRLHAADPQGGFHQDAFEASERARARTLLDILSRSMGAAGQRDELQALQREQDLRSRLHAQSQRLSRLYAAPADKARLDEAQADLRKASQEHRSARQLLEARRSSPLLSRPAVLEEIRTGLLDEESLLLAFSLGRERSYLWALTDDSLRSFQLAPGPELESQARQLLQLWTQRNRQVEGESPASRRERIRKSEEKASGAAKRLSGHLVGPVAELLSRKRLLVVADGALQHVPFSALPLPSGKGADEGLPLAARHEIVHLPSASALLPRRSASSRRTPPTRSLAVLADPVFDSQDPRVSSEATTSAAAVSRGLPPGLPSGEFVRLRFSRQEAELISRLVPSGQRMIALDFEADRETIRTAQLDRFRYLHFATHAWVDSQSPERSGILLSMVDPQGRPRDGFLDLSDIHGLKLNADLVVLSSCRTALGKPVRGEGILGLTRGFLVAGASAVVASLWDVEDRATAEYMRRFYEAMLRDGQRPAAAMRSAQNSMLRDERWKAPYHWAAFTLQGEWN